MEKVYPKLKFKGLNDPLMKIGTIKKKKTILIKQNNKS